MAYKLTINNETHSLVDWAKKNGISKSLLDYRLRISGWNMYDAVTMSKETQVEWREIRQDPISKIISRLWKTPLDKDNFHEIIRDINQVIDYYTLQYEVQHPERTAYLDKGGKDGKVSDDQKVSGAEAV
jgi:hypothetical protein